MATDSVSVGDAGGGANATPRRAQWVLPGLTLLLAALAVVQLVAVVPFAVFAAQRFGMRMPWYMELTWQTPVWLAAVVALAMGLLAYRLRDSLPRSAVLTTVALLVNLGILLSVYSTQAKLLWALAN
jgi:hypothetical protein